MSIWAIVPVKPFNAAKSRLAKVLSPEERQALAERMYRHVLEVLTACNRIAGVMVVSRDTKALSIARDLHFKTVQESGVTELNTALERAAQVAILHRASGILVLPADLPLITVEDIDEIIHMGRFNNTVVLAPDEQNDGTNAMLVSPPGLIGFSFGVGSYERHKVLAEKADAQFKIYHSPRVAMDIDTPADLERYEAIRSNLGEFGTPQPTTHLE